MSKVTGKLQVTIPKAIADQYGIQPGGDVFFEPAGEVVRLRLGAPEVPKEGDLAWKLRLFDDATRRQRAREKARGASVEGSDGDRGWTREGLYDRVLPR